MPKAQTKNLFLSYDCTFLYSRKTGLNTMLKIIFSIADNRF